ncbi:MAG: PorT family protein [Bacteroidetes bacterium]|nr:PorT family protein [Bacteroidota bacterium]
MKTRIFLFSLILLSYSALTQDLDYGLKGGFNIGTPYGVAEEGAKGSPGVGPLIGMYFKYNLNSKWAIHGDVHYSYKGSSFDTPVSGDTLYRWTGTVGYPPRDTSYYVETIYSGRVDGVYANWYFDIPLYISYRIGKRFLLLGGGQLSYLVKGKNSGTADIIVGDPKSPYTHVYDEPFDQSQELNTWDYSGIFGTIFESSRRINVGLTATVGLSSIYKKNYKYLDKAVRNIYLQAFLEFKINGKRNN